MTSSYYLTTRPKNYPIVGPSNGTFSKGWCEKVSYKNTVMTDKTDSLNQCPLDYKSQLVYNTNGIDKIYSGTQICVPLSQLEKKWVTTYNIKQNYNLYSESKKYDGIMPI